MSVRVRRRLLVAVSSPVLRVRVCLVSMYLSMRMLSEPREGQGTDEESGTAWSGQTASRACVTLTVLYTDWTTGSVCEGKA